MAGSPSACRFVIVLILGATAAALPDIQHLKGKHFNLVSEVSKNDTEPHFNQFYEARSNRLRGMSIDLWDWMSKRAGFTYNVTMVPQVGPSAPWLKANLNQNSTFHFTATFWTINLNLISTYPMSIPGVSYGWIIATNVPQAVNHTLADQLFTFAQPLSTSVWLSMSICIVIAGVLIYFLERKGNEDDFFGDRVNARHGIPLSIWMSFMQFTGGGGHTPHTLAGRIFTVSWTFVIMVLLAVYTANLAAFFTAAGAMVQPIQSLADLQQSDGPVCSAGGIAPAFLRSHGITNLIISPSSRYRQSLFGVLEHRCVAAVDKNLRYQVALSQTARLPKLCQLQLVGQPLSSNYMAYAGRVGTSNTTLRGINQLLGEAYSNGVHQQLVNRYVTPSQQAQLACPSPAVVDTRPVSLAELSGLFFILLTAAAAAATAHFARRQQLARKQQLGGLSKQMHTGDDGATVIGSSDGDGGMQLELTQIDSLAAACGVPGAPSGADCEQDGATAKMEAQLAEMAALYAQVAEHLPVPMPAAPAGAAAAVER